MEEQKAGVEAQKQGAEEKKDQDKVGKEDGVLKEGEQKEEVSATKDGLNLKETDAESFFARSKVNQPKKENDVEAPSKNGDNNSTESGEKTANAQEPQQVDKTIGETKAEQQASTPQTGAPSPTVDEAQTKTMKSETFLSAEAAPDNDDNDDDVDDETPDVEEAPADYKVPLTISALRESLRLKNLPLLPPSLFTMGNPVSQQEDDFDQIKVALRRVIMHKEGKVTDGDVAPPLSGTDMVANFLGNFQDQDLIVEVFSENDIKDAIWKFSEGLPTKTSAYESHPLLSSVIAILFQKIMGNGPEARTKIVQFWQSEKDFFRMMFVSQLEESKVQEFIRTTLEFEESEPLSNESLKNFVVAELFAVLQESFEQNWNSITNRAQSILDLFRIMIDAEIDRKRREVQFNGSIESPAQVAPAFEEKLPFFFSLCFLIPHARFFLPTLRSLLAVQEYLPKLMPNVIPHLETTLSLLKYLISLPPSPLPMQGLEEIRKSSLEVLLALVQSNLFKDHDVVVQSIIKHNLLDACVSVFSFPNKSILHVYCSQIIGELKTSAKLKSVLEKEDFHNKVRSLLDSVTPESSGRAHLLLLQTSLAITYTPRAQPPSASANTNTNTSPKVPSIQTPERAADVPDTKVDKSPRSNDVPESAVKKKAPLSAPSALNKLEERKKKLEELKSRKNEIREAIDRKKERLTSIEKDRENAGSPTPPETPQL